MRKTAAGLAALSLTACNTLQGGSAPIQLGSAAQQARTAENRQRQTFVSSAASLKTSGLDRRLVDARLSGASQRILEQCDPATPDVPRGPGPTVAPTILIPLIMAIFNAVTSQIERSIAAAEKRKIASLSDQFTANAAVQSFPLDTEAQVACIVVDDVEVMTSEAGEITELKPRALYALQLRRVGRAFVIEPSGALIGSSRIVRAGLEPKLNVDLSLAMTTVTKSDGTMPGLFGYPAYNVHFENVGVGAPYGPSAASSRSIVLPLPQDSDSPTSLVVAVTESHVTLAKVQQRIALQQETRKALWEAAAEMLKTTLSE